jgi:hypothetical protein
MSENLAHTLEKLAVLLGQRNAIDESIARMIRRPAMGGHIGEFIASAIFDIELEVSATNAGFDGRFRSGPFSGKTVNIKAYGKREGLLDINVTCVPDTYLVLTGSRAAAVSSRGTHRPWVIAEAFIFDAPALVARLKARGVKLGVATSVTADVWESAKVYPRSNRGPMTLTDEAIRLLSLFGEGAKA